MDAQRAARLLQTAVDEAFVRWCAEGVRWVGVRNGIVAESFHATTAPGVLDSARARGVHVLHVADDRLRIIEAIGDSLARVLDDVNATLHAQAASMSPVQRGTA